MSQLNSADDKALSALRHAKTLARDLPEISTGLRDRCSVILSCLDMMLEYGPVKEKSADIVALQSRLNRIIELSNMQECGSLVLEVERAMDSAFQRMP